VQLNFCALEILELEFAAPQPGIQPTMFAMVERICGFAFPHDAGLGKEVAVAVGEPDVVLVGAGILPLATS